MIIKIIIMARLALLKGTFNYHYDHNDLDEDHLNTNSATTNKQLKVITCTT